MPPGQECESRQRIGSLPAITELVVSHYLHCHPMYRLIVAPELVSFTRTSEPYPDLMMSRNDAFVLGALSVSIAMFVLGVGFGLLLGC